MAKAYIPGLDNQTKFVKDVRSILVAPIYGHPQDDDSDNLVAIVQFVNKFDGKITPHDVVSNSLPH